ncbi:unnamed protein product, partial [Ectocarpus sp. 8 AP-2014]
ATTTAAPASPTALAVIVVTIPIAPAASCTSSIAPCRRPSGCRWDADGRVGGGEAGSKGREQLLLADPAARRVPRPRSGCAAAAAVAVSAAVAAAAEAGVSAGWNGASANRVFLLAALHDSQLFLVCLRSRG